MESRTGKETEDQATVLVVDEEKKRKTRQRYWWWMTIRKSYTRSASF